MSNYDEYERECERIREKNNKILDEFEAWLKAKNLSEKTVSKHVYNIDFYINEYLLYEDTTEAEDGIYSVDMFLGYWFIKKAMWSTPASIKYNATSLKKFYEFMLEKGCVTEKDVENLNQTIKKNMPRWLERVRRYNDPEIVDMAEVWGD